MGNLPNAVEILKLLKKTNCQACNEKTCLAFAAAVIQGRRKLSDCPYLDPETLAQFADNGAQSAVDNGMEDRMAELKSRIAGIDLSEAARRTGGEFKNGRLTLKILGKNFSVDANGKLYADIHINHWVAAPFLNYILSSEGKPPMGVWVPFRELPEGRERAALFEKRCEEPMKKLADTLPEFFDDIVHMFSGSQVDPLFESDISVILNPLPKVPLMICYWKPDEGMASNLSLFFDETATSHLDIGSIYTLGAGLSQMFSKLALRHGFAETGTA
jgi:hypothetical protein